MVGVVDFKVFDDNPFRHITGVPEIMLPGIRTADHAGAGWLAACRHENAVADNKFPLPRAAVVGTQVDEGPSANGTVFHGKGTAADGIPNAIVKNSPSPASPFLVVSIRVA